MAASLSSGSTWMPTVQDAAILKAGKRDFTNDLDLSTDEIGYLLRLAGLVKSAPGRYARVLSGRYLSLLFEKPSLRTRLTFELAIKQLGGDAVVSSGPIGEREPIKDIARNLHRWTQGIVARVFSQETILELAQWADVPVINALSDRYHPCQALADMLTLRENFGDLTGRKLAFVGDGNNVAHSLMLCATRLHMDFAIATPVGYEPHHEVVAIARQIASEHGVTVTITHDAEMAVTGASAVYTDVWASMGQETETAERRSRFYPYQVNQDLMACARPEAVFMHCLPAHRGEELSDEVAESGRSLIFDQAENRLHAQKALLLMMLD